MDQNILQDLYDGRINPMERKYIHTKENGRLHESIEDEVEYFLKILPQEETKRFKALGRLYAKANEQLEYDSFSFGFRLGVQLMAAVYTGEGSRLAVEFD